MLYYFFLKINTSQIEQKGVELVEHIFRIVWPIFNRIVCLVSRNIICERERGGKRGRERKIIEYVREREREWEEKRGREREGV